MVKMTDDSLMLPDMLKYEKSTSYGPAQYNGLRAPIKGVERSDWGGGSYTKAGRASEGRAPGYDTTTENKVRPTTSRIK